MSRYKFTHTDIEHHQDYKVEISISGEISISDLLIEMDNFIRACGFHPKGTLEFVEDE